jgi:type 1 fimbria pilin
MMRTFDRSAGVLGTANGCASDGQATPRSRVAAASHTGSLMRQFLLLMLIVLAALLPTHAKAQCTITSGTAPEAVTFSPPTTITISYTAAIGTVIYSSGAVSPTNANSMTCNNNATFGVNNNVGLTPAAGNPTIYPTGVSGLGYEIAHDTSTSYLGPYGCCTIANGSYTNSNASYLYLVKTGPIVSGSVLPAGVLAYWTYANSKNIEAFTLGNSVTIIDPACSVVTTPIAVTLPTLSTSSMASTGAVAGRTPFNITLNCSSGATLDIQLNYNGTNSGITGVLSNATGTGTATGVGVQLLNQSFTPVTFGTTTTVGTTPQGTYTLPYYAQYYRTGTLTAGSVSASATFTLSYQ